MKDSHVTLPSKCWNCEYVPDRAVNVDGGDAVGPTPGDITLCFKCGEWNVFDEKMELRQPTDDEYLEFGTDRGLQRVREAWVELKKEGKTPS